MADEEKRNVKNQLEELQVWMATIPLTKTTKNLSRDLSDAVMMAEILKVYYPRYVDLHNYVPANSITTKKENWQILNRKVLTKIDMKLTKNIINQLANCYPGAAENMLLELRKKVLQDFGNLPRSDKENDSIEDDVSNIKTTISEKSISSIVDQVPLMTFDSKKSIFVRATEKMCFLMKWLISWLCIWNYFRNIKFRSNNNFQCLLENFTKASKTQTTLKNINEEDPIVFHAFIQLTRKLQELDNIISSLNHKIAYLESTIKP